MEPFVKVTGVAAALDRVNVDTDQIIPKQFLKRVERTGFGEFAFFDWRYRPDGSLNSDFELNLPAYQGATILVAGRNFGSGSSREHAPWALADYGFRAVIAPSFGDIFSGNAVQNGLLTAIVSDEIADELMAALDARPETQVTVDLEQQTIAFGDKRYSFTIDPVRRTRLLNGWDDIALTQSFREQIAAFKETDRARRPWARPTPQP